MIFLVGNKIGDKITDIRFWGIKSQISGFGDKITDMRTEITHFVYIHQGIARCLFQLSRQDREFLPFSLMLRDEIENFFPSVSCFETRSRISSLRSHAPRRDREFLSSLSCFETGPRRMFKKMHFC